MNEGENAIYSTPEDIRVERLRQIEADPLRHIIKNQERILSMLEDVLKELKAGVMLKYDSSQRMIGAVDWTWSDSSTSSNYLPHDSDNTAGS